MIARPFLALLPHFKGLYFIISVLLVPKKKRFFSATHVCALAFTSRFGSVSADREEFHEDCRGVQSR